MRVKLTQLGEIISILSKFIYDYEFSSAINTAVSPTITVGSNNSTGLSTNQESCIYGGLDTDVDRYPFTTSLRFDPDGKTFCGGTLVAPPSILTAEHCIKTDKGQIYASLGSELGSGAGSGLAEQIKAVEAFDSKDTVTPCTTTTCTFTTLVC
ncbi:hypothetical protein Pcac1_g20333 [Phytophthora cactorum]|uniref:Peptidase S1 domain-containing protein n=1 Tax=Phytophthora cactorum TaxID=29920 RepID=A0A329RIK9_9STRA|nr:hypothetical protein Pcac1_g20333 [Phytophthora cactorum]KAG2813904.1 hypothetical protein PC112_g14533 [Phytophthora cactorum]KAG2817043.1 hypothetical protein PC111_g12871 [Phytophthora cactorum]KAG2853516.1 hypothetical protein PC113_g14102 [Phytophthora cactorum]KAG2909459.1 hypothetical protein PC115_g13230 [Phytophthora cactorum]